MDPLTCVETLRGALREVSIADCRPPSSTVTLPRSPLTCTTSPVTPALYALRPVCTSPPRSVPDTA
eukprot:48683-Rhodomonas_salina.1